MRKILAIVLTAATIAVVVMASLDRREGLWKHIRQEVSLAPTTPDSAQVVVVDTLSMIAPCDSTQTAYSPQCEADSLTR